MDAATRAELDALRARAYAPGADIHLDPAAMARLEKLQSHGGRHDNAQPDAERSEDPLTAPPSSDAPPASRRQRIAAWVGGSLAALAAGVIAISGITAASAPASQETPAAAVSGPTPPATDFTQRDGYEKLIRITIDGSFGSAANLPAQDIPHLAELGDVLWHEPLGDYYGFALSIAAVHSPLSGEQLCLSAAVPGGVPSTVCSPRGLWRAEGLVLSIPYVGITPADRPDGLSPADDLAFWWVPDDAVLVLRGSE